MSGGTDNCPHTSAGVLSVLAGRHTVESLPAASSAAGTADAFGVEVIKGEDGLVIASRVENLGIYSNYFPGPLVLWVEENGVLVLLEKYLINASAEPARTVIEPISVGFQSVAKVLREAFERAPPGVKAMFGLVMLAYTNIVPKGQVGHLLVFVVRKGEVLFVDPQCCKPGKGGSGGVQTSLTGFYRFGKTGVFQKQVYLLPLSPFDGLNLFSA